MSPINFTPQGDQGIAGLRALLQRAVALDPHALARFQTVGAALNVFVTTPFDCIVARRVAGEISRDGAAVSAAEFLDALGEQTGQTVAIDRPQDASWPGALPPVEGFQLCDEVPVSTARQLADEGKRLAKQFSGPAGPPRSLLDATVITANATSDTPVEVPMRMIFTCTSMGLIPGFEAPAHIPRHLRVASAGRWVRLDAPYGSVFKNAGLSLLF
ncbi:hypothetical protein [Corynebacterium riegelii]